MVITVNEVILCVSDLHAPYMHKDAVKFLKAVKAKYKPNHVVFMGDIIDAHAVSEFQTDSDLDNAGAELRAAIKQLVPLYKEFPKADVLWGNHDLRPLKAALRGGISRSFMRDINEVIRAPKTWKWHFELVKKLKSGNDCLFVHQKGGRDVGLSAAKDNMCIVQGHEHSKFEIMYRANHYKLMWGMTCGCLVDDNSFAFLYSRTSSWTAKSNKFIIGCSLIIDGQPRLIPMLLDRRGKWTGKIS